MIHTLNQGQSIQVDINELPESLQQRIKDAENHGYRKMNTAAHDLEKLGIEAEYKNNFLDPWIYVDEKEKHEIVEMTLSHIENAEEVELEEDEDADKMPLPKYFQDLYTEFGTLKDFDLKDVIYEPKEQERFMARVRTEIENKQSITKLKKRELWKVVKESKFPIMLGVLVTLDATIELGAGALWLSAISYLRTGIFFKMTQEGLRRGAIVVKNEKTQKQYQEVADELQNLKSIISSVAGQENAYEPYIEEKISEEYQDKQLGYTQTSTRKNKASPWWWPF